MNRAYRESTMNQSLTMTKIEELEKEIESRTSDGEWIFRGESKLNEKVSSTLYRKCIELPKTNQSNVDKTMELAEGLTQVGIGGGFSLGSYRGLPPPTPNWGLYVSIAAQHLGYKANLIDFTKDFKIALFFACCVIPSFPTRVADEDESGRLIMLRKDDERLREHLIEPEEIISNESALLREAEESVAIDHIKKNYDSLSRPISGASEEVIRQITSPDRIEIARQSLQSWWSLIPDVTSRVKAQKSIFVKPPKGYIPRIKNSSQSGNSDIIEIPANLKKSILDYVSYKINYITLFADFFGHLATQDDLIKISDGGIRWLQI